MENVNLTPRGVRQNMVATETAANEKKKIQINPGIKTFSPKRRSLPSVRLEDFLPEALWERLRVDLAQLNLLTSGAKVEIDGSAAVCKEVPVEKIPSLLTKAVMAKGKDAEDKAAFLTRLSYGQEVPKKSEDLHVVPALPCGGTL